MATPIQQFVNIRTTQGGADAFVQTEEYTGISPADGLVWLIKRIEVSFTTACGLQGISADAEISFALSRETAVAVVEKNDSACLYKGGFVNSLTTSGQIEVPREFVYVPEDGLVIVGPSLFAQLDSTATGLTLVADWRIFYNSVKISELEILRMLSQG